MKKSYLAEFIGTFWLVLGGCGSAVLAGTYIGTVGVALAFGLTALTMIYAMGHVSGGHFNPTVTFGLWAGGRFDGAQVVPYIMSQVLGGLLAACVLYVVLSGSDMGIGNFAANGYGEHSPGRFTVFSAFVCEFIMTFMFVIIVLGATDSRSPKGFAGVAIGLALTLIHLVTIPVTNTSVNPARSISQALFVGGWAVDQLWLFIIAPVFGGLLAGVLYRWFWSEK